MDTAPPQRKKVIGYIACNVTYDLLSVTKHLTNLMTLQGCVETLLRLCDIKYISEFLKRIILTTFSLSI